MKHWMLGIALVCLCSSLWAGENPSLSLGHGYAIEFSLSYDPYIVGVRDFYNGQWLAGYGKELFPITRNGVEILYIAGYNVFNADEAGKGAVGLSVGCRPVAFINEVGEIVGATHKVITLPPFAEKIGKLSSLEFGYARRFFNASPSWSRDVWSFGGQVALPLSGLLSSN